MVSCCNNCYPVCDAIASCFDAFLIYTPLTYTGESIQVSITNGQRVTVNQTLDVVAASYVTLDLTEFPDGFFSAYGGPYTLEFYNPTTGQKISLATKDTNTYYCIQFTATNQTGGDGTVFINAFSDEVPAGYASV